MSASKDDAAAGDGLLADAAALACVFDFAAAEDLCQRILAREADDPASRHAARAWALLRAIEHNRSSYLYGLALKRHDAGDSGPSAPLSFAVRLLGKVKFAGSFDVQFEEKAMVVTGSVSDASRVLHVFINELLIASIPTEPDKRRLRRARLFTFRIGARSLSLFPAGGQARLAISTGKDILCHAAGDTFYRCNWPGGKGGIEAAILKGAMLTAHHQIQPAPAQATVDRWLDAYETLAAFMSRETGKPLFLYYGSLLGAVRDNRIIPFDDDFDVAYFSDRTAPSEVKNEMISIVAALAASHPDMVIRLMNFFFKIRFRGSIVDVFPAWHDGRILWSPWSTRLECSERDLLKQVMEKQFHGRRVLVPARAEQFLELKYGAGWRTPDPAYRVRELPSEAYPFRRIPFGAEDRSQILDAARKIAGNGAVATVKLMDE